jgi:hypothetical protein
LVLGSGQAPSVYAGDALSRPSRTSPLELPYLMRVASTMILHFAKEWPLDLVDDSATGPGSLSALRVNVMGARRLFSMTRYRENPH